MNMMGWGRDVSAERLIEVPALLSTLVANVQAMGIEFHNRFKVHLGNKFSPKFGFHPSWQMKKISKRLKDYDDIDVFDSDLCDGGELYLRSEGRLQSKDNCYVWLPDARRPGNWEGNTFEAYCRYMTAIITWSKLRDWTTTQIEATIFYEFMPHKLAAAGKVNPTGPA
jgi:hypothetical protein